MSLLVTLLVLEMASAGTISVIYTKRIVKMHITNWAGYKIGQYRYGLRAGDGMKLLRCYATCDICGQASKSSTSVGGAENTIFPTTGWMTIAACRVIGVDWLLRTVLVENSLQKEKPTRQLRMHSLGWWVLYWASHSAINSKLKQPQIDFQTYPGEEFEQ